jgi:WD40 repeat protein
VNDPVSAVKIPGTPLDIHPTGADKLHPPAAIPDHELIRCIGVGSYGEVWLARSVMGTYRAIKVVSRSRFESERPYEREFSGIQKFEPISRTHEGLVNILQIGRNDRDGYFYYVMELADDSNAECGTQNADVALTRPADTLSHRMHRMGEGRGEGIASIYVPKTIRTEISRRGRLPFEECLQLSLSLTTALGHLHKAGLVHRDIKPSNIIFVNGAPKLADIGLVTDVGEAKSFVGTEGFIPPEGPGTPQADIYSLGKVLYEISTGKDRQSFPEPPTMMGELADRERLLELNEVILKACESDAPKRYESAEGMRQELVLLLGGQSVKRLRVAERRLAIFTKVGVFLVVLAVIASAIFCETNRQRRIATRSLVRLHVVNGTRQMNEGDFLSSLLSFTEALRLDAGSAKREESHRIRIGSVLRQCPKLVGVFGHERAVNGAAFSPDSSRLITGSDDHTAKVWDLVSGTNLFNLEHRGPVYSVAFSPDNRYIMTISSDNRPHLWNTETGEPVPQPSIRHLGQWVNPQPRFSPDGGRLLTLVERDAAQVWDVATGQATGLPLQHDQEVTFFEFNPDGHFVVTLANDNQARVWDSFTGKLRHSFPLSGFVDFASFSPDNRVLATASNDGHVRFWDLSAGGPLLPSLEHRTGVERVCWSPEGDRVVTTCWDNSVHIWDFASRKPLIPPITHELQVFNSSFTPDGRRVATISGGNLLRTWDADTGKLVVPMLRHSDWRQAASFSSEGRLVAVFQREQVRVWDIGRIEPEPLRIRAVAFFKESSVSPNGRFKATILGDNTVQTVDLDSAEPLPQPTGLIGPVRQVFFGSDSEILITERGDTRARAWDLLTGAPLTPLLKTRYAQAARLISKRDLPRDDRPVLDLLDLARLLSGNRIDETGGFRPLEVSELVRLWTALRIKYPESFRGSSDDVFGWHEQEAQACEQAWDWWSAIFHLDRLIASRPQDASLHKRRRYAQIALDQANNTANGYLNKSGVIPPRNPSANPKMIDLSSYYNSSKRSGPGSLASLPSGLQTMAGTTFDIRGVIQLSRRRDRIADSDYPENITGIRIGLKARRLHFLHATTFEADGGTRVGNYVVRYASNESRVFPIVYGKDVRNWWTIKREPLTTQNSSLAWVGSNAEVQSESKALRMFKSTWENPFPDEEIASIDFVSSLSDAAPFLVAITAD